MIGKLRHRLTIQAANPTADVYGGQQDPWAQPTSVARVWGQIRPLRGTEQLRGMQLEGRVSHRIVIRKREGVTSAMRIKFGARLFNIRAVIDPGEEKRWLELLCDEGVAT